MAASDPEILILSPGVWTEVAAAMTSGFIHILNPNVIYYQTYRLTTIPKADPPASTPVPGDADFEGAVIYNRIDRVAGKSVSVGGAVVGGYAGNVQVDVYVYVQGDEDGRIRLDRGD